MISQGTDILDVDDVVQFMTPEVLSVWIQRAGRAGRAGRDGRLSRAILLVEPSVVKKLGATSFKPPKCLGNIVEGTVSFAFYVGEALADFLLLQIAKRYLKQNPTHQTSPMLQVLRKATVTPTAALCKTLRWTTGRNLMKTPFTKRSTSVLRCGSG